MADNTNPQSGGTIDLRQTQAGQTGQSAGAAGTAGAGSQGDDIFSKFDIPETVKQQYPDLIPLILQTESMTDDERQYWFQILPIMTDEQVKKLREILDNEKKQLENLDKKYDKEVKKINDKHVIEWKAAQAKEKRQKLQATEGEAEKTEKEKEEELLKKLQGI
ncbi:MAG: hypothetical protein AAB739_03305 [Patescibacteria group bacterium]